MVILTGMKKSIKKYFIPHEGNEYKPHILRIEAVVFILSGILIVETLFLVQSFVIFKQTGFFAKILPDVLVDQTNDNREEESIVSLRVNPLLEEAARLKAEDMANGGYFAHTSPTGKNPWYWLGQVDYTFTSAGENLAVNFVDSEDVTEAWMDSPGHRANILNGNFTEIGIATARGTYKGKQTVFVVQFFGRPAAAKAAVADVETAPVEEVEIGGQAPEEVAVNSPDEEMFLEIQGAAVEEEAVEITAEEKIPQQSSLIEGISAKPHETVNYLLLMLGTIIALALALKVFIKIQIQHTALIVNGVMLLIVISSVIMLNQYISLVGAEII